MKLLPLFACLAASPAWAWQCIIPPAEVVGTLPVAGAIDVPRNAQILVQFDGTPHWYELELALDGYDEFWPLVVEGPDGVTEGTWGYAGQGGYGVMSFVPDDLLVPGEYVVRWSAAVDEPEDEVQRFTVADTMDETAPDITHLTMAWRYSADDHYAQPGGLRMLDGRADEPVWFEVQVFPDETLEASELRSAFLARQDWFGGGCSFDGLMKTLSPADMWLSVRAIDQAGNASEPVLLGPRDIRHQRPVTMHCQSAPAAPSAWLLLLTPLLGLARRSTPRRGDRTSPQP